MCRRMRTARSPAWRRPAPDGVTAWACANGEPWDARGPARTIARFSRPIFRGRRLNASIRVSIRAVIRALKSRLVNQTACLRTRTRRAGSSDRGHPTAAPLSFVFLIFCCFPGRAAAQGVLREFSYDELRPTALQVDFGPIGATRLEGTTTAGVRLDYGRIAPRVRLLVGLSYYRAEFNGDEIARFEQR